MPIENINQPDIIHIKDDLRLRKFDHNYACTYEWYQNQETVRLFDCSQSIYDKERVLKMYDYLEKKGELYFIEVLEEGNFKPIDDVTFWEEDMPIVIGELKYRGLGIGKLVIKTLIERAKLLGYRVLHVGEIYTYNLGSQKLFESLGFVKDHQTAHGYSYCLNLFNE